jgi:CBS domain-containing protein
MATINEIMTREVSTIQLSDAVQTAAQRMRDLDVGVLPVCDGDTLVGMVTDRDIAVRGVAAGLNPADALVADVMTDEVHSCSATDTVDVAMKQMGDVQVRRLAVLDPKRRIVGIVTLGDLATRQSAPTNAALREISESGPTA